MLREDERLMHEAVALGFTAAGAVGLPQPSGGLNHMLGQHNFVLSLITHELAAALGTLAGCARATTPGVTPTPLTVPPPTPEVSDFRTLLPAAPPGFGKLANHLLFFSDRSGTYELYQIDLEGSNLVQLTQNSAYEWSPDGQWIAFTSTRDHRETYDLCVSSTDGSNPTRVTSDPAHDIIPRRWP
jgi:hypothetical protein